MMALVCLLSYLTVVRGDLEAMFRPAFTLTRSPGDAALFRVSQIAACFGVYLPLLVIGTYLRGRLRPFGGTAVDAGILFLTVSTELGVAGSAVQIATLAPFADAYGEPAVQQATAAAWLAVVDGAQKGLGVMEGPTLGFWAIVNGVTLLNLDDKLGTPLVLVGIFYILYAGLDGVALLVELVVLPAQVLWMALFGMDLLRRPPLAR